MWIVGMHSVSSSKLYLVVQPAALGMLCERSLQPKSRRYDLMKLSPHLVDYRD